MAPHALGQSMLLVPRRYLVGDVGPHLSGVPAAPQQQRLMLVAIKEFERLPHLRPKHGQFDNRNRGASPGPTPSVRTFTVSRLAPSSTTRSRRCPRTRLASNRTSSSSCSFSPRGRLGAAILSEPHNAASPPRAPPMAAAAAQDGTLPSLPLGPLPERGGRQRQLPVSFPAGRAARRGHGAEPEGPGGAAAGWAAWRWHRPQAAAGRRRPGLWSPRVRFHR